MQRVSSQCFGGDIGQWKKIVKAYRQCIVASMMCCIDKCTFRRAELLARFVKGCKGEDNRQFERCTKLIQMYAALVFLMYAKANMRVNSRLEAAGTNPLSLLS